MCGYFGILVGKTPEGRQVLERFQQGNRPQYVKQELEKRGLDDYGDSQSDTHFFAHSRLAIRGSSDDGAQPFKTLNDRYQCLFNGEIYAIDGFDKAYMDARGDTQALRKSLEGYGVEEVLTRLNGMFSLAIHDLKDHKLYLALDYFGQKPLYFAKLDHGIVFGSTAKLVAHGTSQWDISAPALSGYLKFGFVPPDQAIFQGIQKLQPGHMMTVDLTNTVAPQLEKIQQRNVHLDPGRPVLPPTADGLAEVLEASVERHLISDYPVGICLSGGIDSSLVARYFNKEQAKNLIAFSVDDHSDDSEISQAHRFADHNSLKFVTCDLTQDTIGGLYENVMSCLDEPHSDTAILSSSALFERARKDVKVVLTGDGGDELFQGYNRHRLFNLLSRYGALNAIPAALLRKMARLAAWMPKLSGQQRRILQNALRNGHSVDAFIQSMLLIDDYGHDSFADLPACNLGPHECDQQFYLPGNNMSRMDRVSLYYGIEARAPLLDLELLHFSRNVDFSKPEFQGKGLPKALHRQAYEGVEKFEAKRGFNTPISDFVGTDMAQKLGRLGAECAGDHCGVLFKYDQCSERRKYNLTVLGSWIDTV